MTREMTPARWQLLKSITVAPRDITFPSVVLYFRPSCGYCTLMLPEFLDVMKREGNVVKFFAVDTAVHGNATGDKGLLLSEAQSRTVPHVVFQHSPKKQIVYTDVRQVKNMVNFIQKEMKRSLASDDEDESGDRGDIEGGADEGNDNEGDEGDVGDSGDIEGGGDEGDEGESGDRGDIEGGDDEGNDNEGDEGDSGNGEGGGDKGGEGDEGDEGDSGDKDGDQSTLDGGSTDNATRYESSFDDDASAQQKAQDASNKKIRFNEQLTYKQPRVREFLINSLYELKNKATARFGDEYSDMFDAENASVYFVGIKPYTYADYENNLAQITEEEESLAKDEEESITSPSDSGIAAGSIINNEDGDEEEDGSTDDEEEEEDSDDEEEEEDSDDEEEEDSSSTDDDEEEEEDNSSSDESGEEEEDDATGVVSGGFIDDDGEEEESDDDDQNSADDGDDGDDTEHSLISQIRSNKCNTFLYDDVKSEIESSMEKHYFIFILLMPENIHFRVDGMPVFACITGDRNSGLSAKIYLKTNPVNILKLMCKQGFSRAPADNILIQILREMKYTVKQ